MGRRVQRVRRASSANWNYNVGNGLNPGLNTFDGWGNGEWEWYRPENCTQSGGNLVMRANWLTTPITVNGRNFYQTSCRMTTDTKRSFQYGRIEARMALPTATGSWPAFWMLGDACDETSTSAYNPAQTYYDRLPTNWASCGEVDIMEHANANATVTNNIFWDLRTGVFPWTAGQNANYVANPAVNNAAAFHVYAIEWTAAQIRWYIDGVQTHVIDTTPATLEEFRKPFHVIFNLALGGTYPGQNPVQSQFPLTASIDYVRYYQDGGGTTPPSTGGPATQINGPGGKCVDVGGNDTGGNGAAVQLWTCQGPSVSRDQQWSGDGQTLRTWDGASTSPARVRPTVRACSSGTATAAAHRTGSRKVTGCATRTPTGAWTPRTAQQRTRATADLGLQRIGRTVLRKGRVTAGRGAR